MMRRGGENRSHLGRGIGSVVVSSWVGNRHLGSFGQMSYLPESAEDQLLLSENQPRLPRCLP